MMIMTRLVNPSNSIQLPLISVHVAPTQDVSPSYLVGHVGPVVEQGDGKVPPAAGSKTEVVDKGHDPYQSPEVNSKE